MPAACLTAVTCAFARPAERVVAVHEVDAEIAARGLTVVTGASGCGKTTLLTVVMGERLPDAGRVVVFGADLARLSASGLRRLRRRTLGVALPRPSDNFVDRLDAGENFALIRKQRSAAIDFEHALEPLGLADRQHARIDELSGGEQQRFALAMALLGTPELVLLDEPTSELDATNGRRVVDLLVAHASQRALFVATHDPAVVEAADAVIVLEAGRRVA